jgi:AraC-like DNA-binding protein
MINFFYRKPAPKLSHLINHFWAVEGDGSQEFLHKSVAIGQPYLVFHYHGCFDEVRGSNRFKCPTTHYHGQTQNFRLFSTSQGFGVFGVNFYPYVTPMLLSASAESLTNRFTDFHDLVGKEAKELESRMIEASDNLERIDIINSYVEKKILNKKCINDHIVLEAVRHVMNSTQSETVGELAYKFNLSKRQFERKFKEYSGLEPKLFSRIARFQRAYNICQNKNQALLQTALECGYFDQAHFNHEFKAFAGFPPSEIQLQKVYGSAEFS